MRFAHVFADPSPASRRLLLLLSTFLHVFPILIILFEIMKKAVLTQKKVKVAGLTLFHRGGSLTLNCLIVYMGELILL